ncbi:hypothetical protein OKW48_006383 [Paraburkholderia youngii]
MPAAIQRDSNAGSMRKRQCTVAFAVTRGRCRFASGENIVTRNIHYQANICGGDFAHVRECFSNWKSETLVYRRQQPMFEGKQEVRPLSERVFDNGEVAHNTLASVLFASRRVCAGGRDTRRRARCLARDGGIRGRSLSLRRFIAEPVTGPPVSIQMAVPAQCAFGPRRFRVSRPGISCAPRAIFSADSSANR